MHLLDNPSSSSTRISKSQFHFLWFSLQKFFLQSSISFFVFIIFKDCLRNFWYLGKQFLHSLLHHESIWQSFNFVYWYSKISVPFSSFVFSTLPLFQSSSFSSAWNRKYFIITIFFWNLHNKTFLSIYGSYLHLIIFHSKISVPFSTLVCSTEMLSLIFFFSFFLHLHYLQGYIIFTVFVHLEPNW